MDTRYIPSPRLVIDTRGLSGDQEIISQDVSPFREGSGWNWQAGSTMYVLVGNQIGMKHWSHNVKIDPNGTVTGRDDAGACVVWVYCEDETMRYFYAPLGAIGTLPVFSLVQKEYRRLPKSGHW